MEAVNQPRQGDAAGGGRGEGDQRAAPRNTGITILLPWPSLPRTPPKAAF